MKIKMKKLNKNAIIPTSGSEYAAGLDLYANVDKVEGVIIYPGQTVMIPTGIAMALPDMTFGAVFARSGLSIKSGLRPANCVGVVDSDYRGEVMVALHNDSDSIRSISYGDRVAQLVIMPYVGLEIETVKSLPDTDRGTGGFGSTGK